MNRPLETVARIHDSKNLETGLETLRFEEEGPSDKEGRDSCCGLGIRAPVPQPGDSDVGLRLSSTWLKVLLERT